MKKTKDINVNLFRVDGDIAPFVIVDYMDKNAQEHTGLMLLDSGSSGNILFGNMSECIGDLGKIEGEKTKFKTSANVIVEADNVNFSFVMGGVQFHEKFCLCDQPFPGPLDKMPPIIGILGLAFMVKHQLVIDYKDFTFHTSRVNSESLTISDCEFFFPMEVGMKYYNLPILIMIQDDWQLIAIVDTGATNNIIASQTLRDNGLKCQYLNDTDTIIGIGGRVEVKNAEISFGLLTLKEGDSEQIQRSDVFLVTPHCFITPEEGECDENGKLLEPVEAAIGSPFMAKEGWTIDFGAMIVYKRKVA